MAYEQVQAQFNTATTYATAATSRAESFIAALNSVVGSLTPPPVDVVVEPVAAPALDAVTLTSISAPSTAFPTDGSLAPASPSITIFDPGAPASPSLPTYTYSEGAMPELPQLEALSTISLPAAPDVWTPPSTPDMLSISVVPFGGVDMHTDWAERLSNPPADLSLAAPTAFVSPLPNRYDSALLTDITNLLRARAQGGTGLAPAVEQAIWDRDRARVAAAAAAQVAEATRNAEARGFAMPTGAFLAQLREAQVTQLGKTVEASHDIAIKQADLEQKNAQHAIEQGIALEGRLIEYVNSIEQRTFDAAKFAASNGVEIYNALVSGYRAVLEKYTSYANVYRSLIDAEKTKVEVYQAQIEAEKTKAEINRSLIEQMRAQIDVRNAFISLYKAQLEGVQAQLSVDKMKIDAFGSRIQAYTAQVNAETTRVEAFKAKVQSNVAQADLYKTQVEGYAATINAGVAKAQAEANIYDTSVRAFTSKVQAFGTRVQAESERVKALVSIEELKLGSDKLKVEAAASKNQVTIEEFRAIVQQYEATKQIAMSQAKLLSDNYMAIKGIVTEAAKVSAQVNAQLAASAYGTVHAGAQISGSDSTSVGFSYSGDTSDTRAAPGA